MGQFKHSFFSFVVMTQQFGETIISSSDTASFLKEGYREPFIKYVYNDYNELIYTNSANKLLNGQLYHQMNVGYSSYFNKTENGLMQTTFDLHEILRFFQIQYFINETRNPNNISDIIYDFKWYDLNEILLYLIRPWYENMVGILDDCLFNMVEKNKLLYIIFFSVLLVLASIYYWIFWKNYEENFINLITKSFDLINLIPEEIKNIIVLKLNE